MILTKETTKKIDELVRCMTQNLHDDVKRGFFPDVEDLSNYCDLLTAIGNLSGHGGDNLNVVGFNAPDHGDSE